MWPNTTVISSLFFVTNVYHLSYKQHPYYKLSFILLTGSSLLYHSFRDSIFFYYFDQLAVYNIVLLGGYEYYKYLNRDSSNIYTSSSLINVTSFISVILLYMYGYCSKESTTCIYQDNCHSLLHAITSIGHHAIINML
jgi:hypothetical protein